MRLARIVPATAPTTCTATMAGTCRPSRWPSSHAPRVTAGLKSAETVPKIEMTATSTPAVAAAFWNNCRPTSVGLSRAAMIPEPTTPTSSSAVPRNSAARTRRKGAMEVLPPVGARVGRQASVWSRP